MLVLSRFPEETIYIGDDIKVTIIRVLGQKVRIGIEAPDHVPVHRKDVYDNIQLEKKAKRGDK